MKLGNSILKYRKKYNLSQEDLAKEIDVTRQTISKWELNETTPDLKQALKLSKLFNISIDELINANNNKNYNISNQKKSKKNIIFKIIKTISLIIGIILFIICAIIILDTYTKDYFSVSPTGQGVGTYCNYKNNIIHYEVWRYYNTNEIFLNTSDEEIINKFRTYDYVNEKKMLNDIIEYIENNGGTCNIEIEK